MKLIINRWKIIQATLVVMLLVAGCSKDDPIEIEPDNLTDIYIPDNSFKTIGYLPYYRFSEIENIDFGIMNYVNIAFGNLDTRGNIVVGNNVSIHNAIQKIHTAGAKAFLSLAGGALSAEQVESWKKYLSAEHRENTVIMIKNYAISHNLDGVDVDIENNLIPELGADYNAFILLLKKHLHSEGKAITAALMPISISSVISSSALRAFDFINIMAYNETGLWNISNPGPHSSYEFAVRSINFWAGTQNIDPQKLVLGVPFYGVDFNPSFPATKTYRTFVALNPENAYTDNVDQGYYNGIPTIVNKTILALEQVNGIMIWELGQDMFSELSLARAIGQVVDAWPCGGTAISTYFADADGDGFGDLNKPIQDCSPPEGYVNNRDDSDDTNSNIH